MSGKLQRIAEGDWQAGIEIINEFAAAFSPFLKLSQEQAERQQDILREPEPREQLELAQGQEQQQGQRQYSTPDLSPKPGVSSTF